MRRILYLGALGVVAALPWQPSAVGQRGHGGGRPAAQPAARPANPSFSRPGGQPMARPSAPAGHSSFGPARAGGFPQGQGAGGFGQARGGFAQAAPGARPSPGGLNHAGPSPSVIRPANSSVIRPGGQANVRPINHALPAGPSPSVLRPSGPGAGGTGSVIRPGGSGSAIRPGGNSSIIRPGGGGGGTALGLANRPGAGGGGTQLPADRPNIFPSRPGQGGGGTQLPADRPSRPGQGGSGTQLPVDRPSVLPSRPGQGGSGTQWRPDRPTDPSRPGQGGSGTQWRPDRPNILPSRPGQGGSGTQWRPDRPNIVPSRPGQGGSGTQWRPDRPNRPDRPIINNGNINIGNRPIQNNINNINYSQWNQYNQATVVGGGYNRPWYGSPGYWKQPFYGGLPAGYWSRPWNNYHYGWLNGYWLSAFNAVPSFWAGAAVESALDPTSAFTYSNPYYVDPSPDVNVIVQGLNYAQPIPAPTVEQTVIAYPPAPDQADVQAGEPLPTTPPPAPPEDDTATAANKLFDAARLAFKEGRYADAQALVEQAIAKLPSDAALHEFRALALFAQGKYKDASAGLYAVLAAGPGWNWETVRSLYGDAEDYTKHLRALEHYAGEKPDASDGRFLLAYHYLVLGAKDEAVKQFREVVRVQPDDQLSAALLNALTTPPKEGGSVTGQ